MRNYRRNKYMRERQEEEATGLQSEYTWLVLIINWKDRAQSKEKFLLNLRKIYDSRSIEETCVASSVLIGDDSNQTRYHKIWLALESHRLWKK